jgi:hypothetical protein
MKRICTYAGIALALSLYTGQATAQTGNQQHQNELRIQYADSIYQFHNTRRATTKSELKAAETELKAAQRRYQEAKQRDQEVANASKQAKKSLNMEKKAQRSRQKATDQAEKARMSGM